MRILIHSNGPHVRSGYGVQTNLLVRQLQSLGHTVAVSCFYGVAGSAIEWNGITLYPSGMAEFGVDMLPGHALAFQADLVICLMDFYKLYQIAGPLSQFPFKIAGWVPVDTNDKIGKGDLATLQGTKAYPIAISQHGLKMMTDAGLDADYIPHAVDTDVYKPAEDRMQVRWEQGNAGKFVIGINAANSDEKRKSFTEQLMAFKLFRDKHPDAELLLHTLMRHSRGLDLWTMCEDLGIDAHVRSSDQYSYISGSMDEHAMSEWYGSLDILSNASHGEGFGIPVLEAQACGTPVVVTRASAMTELCGSGWKVDGEPLWNPWHRAEWVRPSIKGILAAYEKAYLVRGSKSWRDKAVKFAEPYDYRTVATQYWKPFLDKVERELTLREKSPIISA